MLQNLNAVRERHSAVSAKNEARKRMGVDEETTSTLIFGLTLKKVDLVRKQDELREIR